VLTNSELREWAEVKALLGQAKDKAAFLGAIRVAKQALS
jgi:hypothetical protein